MGAPVPWPVARWIWGRVVVHMAPSKSQTWPKTNCPYCGVRFQRNHPEHKPTRDHVHPASMGGILVIPCCNECNLLKGDMLMADWIKSDALHHRRRDIQYRLHTVRPWKNGNLKYLARMAALGRRLLPHEVRWKSMASLERLGCVKASGLMHIQDDRVFGRRGGDSVMMYQREAH